MRSKRLHTRLERGRKHPARGGIEPVLSARCTIGKQCAGQHAQRSLGRFLGPTHLSAPINEDTSRAVSTTFHVKVDPTADECQFPIPHHRSRNTRTVYIRTNESTHVVMPYLLAPYIRSIRIKREWAARPSHQFHHHYETKRLIVILYPPTRSLARS